MPKTLGQLKNAKRNVKRAGGKKIEWLPIAKQIIESGNYYTVTEVWKSKTLVNKRVSRFRTMKLLNKTVGAKRMTRLFQDGRFYYGAPEK